MGATGVGLAGAGASYKVVGSTGNAGEITGSGTEMMGSGTEMIGSGTSIGVALLESLITGAVLADAGSVLD